MVHPNIHDKNCPFSCKRLAQYMNAMDSTQYQGMEKFYAENGPSGDKTWPQCLQDIDKQLGQCEVDLTQLIIASALLESLKAAAKAGGKPNAKLTYDVYTLTAENQESLFDEPAKVAGK